MSEILYCIFIFPLCEILRFILIFLHDLSGSWGGSIVLLGILVNIFLLKLYNLANAKAAQMSALKQNLDARIRAWKGVYNKTKVFAFSQVLYSQNNFHPIFMLKSLGALILQIPFFYAMYFVLRDLDGLNNESFLWIADLSKSDSVYGIHILPILMSLFGILNVFALGGSKGIKAQGIIICILFLILLYNMPSSLVLYWCVNMAFSLFIALFSFNKIKNAKFFKLKFFSPNSNIALKSHINILIILNIVFLICIFHPFGLYASDVSVFDSSNLIINLSALVGAFILFSFILIYICSFLKQTRAFNVALWLNLAILFIQLLYTFAFDFNLGIMNDFMFENDYFSNPELRTQRKIIMSIAIWGSLFMSFYFLKKYLFILKRILMLLLCIFVGVSAINTGRIAINFNAIPKANSFEIPYKNELFSYSREKNIVIIVLDAFIGSHFGKILDNFDEFKNDYEGFIYFPNTATSTASTVSSVASLIGGEYYSAFNINKRKQDIRAQIDNAFGQMGLNFAQNGYEVSYFLGDVGYGAQNIQNIAQNKIFALFSPNIFRLNFPPYFETIKKLNYDKKHYEIYQLLLFGLFKVAPERTKTILYNDGLWVLNNKKAMDIKSALQNASSLYAFSQFNNLNSSKPTFKYLHSLVTHSAYHSYFDGKTCDYLSEDSILNHKKIELKSKTKQHFDTEICALLMLKKYFNWLKENEIYDKTQIFIVSDHGIENIFGTGGMANALFLFKDFNAKGSLKIDKKLMANYDLASIFCENLPPNSCANVGTNAFKNYNPNRSILFGQLISWRIQDQNKDEFLFSSTFRIQGGLDKKNFENLRGNY